MRVVVGYGRFFVCRCQYSSDSEKGATEFVLWVPHSEDAFRPKIWYEANRNSGKAFCVAGILVFVSALVVMIFGRRADPDHAVLALLAVLLLSVVGATVYGVKSTTRM